MTAPAPSTPLPHLGLHPGDARRLILEMRVLSDGESSRSAEAQNLAGTSLVSPAVEVANMSARKESTAGVGPDGKSDEEDNRNDEDDEDDEPYFANTSRVLFGTNDLLASSPAAVPDSLPPAVEIGNTSGGGGLGAPIGPQPLFKRTLLCFDDVVGSGRIWTPINLRGDADPHWREVPHNPAHPPVPGEGTCHPSNLTHPDSSLPAIIHEHHARLAAEGTLFATTIANLEWAASLIDNCGYDLVAGAAKLKIPRWLRQRHEMRPFVFPATGANPFVGARLPPGVWVGDDPMDLLRPRRELNPLREGVDVPSALTSSIYGRVESKRRENAFLNPGQWKGEVTPVEELGRGLVELPWGSREMSKAKGLDAIACVAGPEIGAEDDGGADQQQHEVGEKDFDHLSMTAREN